MNKEQDVWEEEIDLREVARGIGRKWYVWVFLPLLVALITGAYYLNQPVRYQIKTGVEVEASSLVKDNVSFPSLDDEKVKEFFEKNVDDQRLPTIKQSKEENVQTMTFKWQGDQKQLEVSEIEKLISDFTNQFKSRYREKFVQEIEEDKKSYETKLADLKKDINAWQNFIGYKTEESIAQFASNFHKLRTSIRAHSRVLARMSEENSLFKWNQAEITKKRIGPDRIRNTALAGVVSFLLIFFGVAFWEIL